MAIDEMPVQAEVQDDSARWGMNSKIKAILIVLAVLVVAEIYSVSRIATLGKAFKAQDAKTRQELTAQFNDQLSKKLLKQVKPLGESLEGSKCSSSLVNSWA